MDRCSVALLGEPRVFVDDVAVHGRAKKAIGLFLYLAQHGSPVSRRELARLFWGGSDDEAARTSLRTALQRLPPELVPLVAAGRDRVALAVPVALDTARFEACAGAEDLDRLAEAAQIYRGAFWQGEDVDATPEFDDWLQRERTRYRQLAQGVFERLIGRHVERAQRDRARAAADRETALATARRWAALEPAAEPAHRWLMQLHADAGQPEAALAQYEICRRELAVAHGRAPGAETQRLHEAILTGARRADASAAPALAARVEARVDAKLSGADPDVAGTTFVGRIDALAALERVYADPSCRLLTLHGLGGTGKSRLAQVLAQQLASRHARGATWVSLQGTRTADELIHAIARALGLDLRGTADAGAALAAALRAHDGLVVLDNFEQLVDAPGAVDAVLVLLHGAPALRLLATSREVLGLQEEWIYEVPGLECPAADAAPGTLAPAAELFVQRARQAYFGFSMNAEWPHVVRICRLVDGLPLALELAAAWVRTTPCGDLAAVIEREAAALASRHRNRPARQQGLDAVVRTSWEMLSREQRSALAPLGLFAESFSQSSAQLVAETSLRALSALVDKSLVRRRHDGRLALHPIVAQFARSRLEEQPKAAQQARRLFARHFGSSLLRASERLDGPDDLEADAELAIEFANLVAAADIWLEEPVADAAAYAEPMIALLHRRNLWRDAKAQAGRWLERDLAPATRARLETLRALAIASLGDSATSKAAFAAARELARASGQSDAVAYASVHSLAAGFVDDDVDAIEAGLRELEPLLAGLEHPGLLYQARLYRAMATYNRGRIHDALAQLRALADDTRAHGSKKRLAQVNDMLASALMSSGEFEGVEALLAEAAAIHERTGSLGQLGRTTNLRAAHALWRPRDPDPEAALAHAARAVDLIERVGNDLASAAEDTRGLALWALGRLDDAAASFERAIEIGANTAVYGAESGCHLALVRLEQGLPEAPRRVAADVLALAHAHDLGIVRTSAVLAASAVLAQADPRSAVARAWLARLLADPDLGVETRQRAQALHARLVGAGAPEAPLPEGTMAEWLRAIDATLRA